jgi:antirestriction protein ArdC
LDAALVGRACRSELVVYANRITRTETDEKGAEIEREIPFLKGYTVFNAEQCEGLPAQYSAKAEPPALPPAARIERADRFFAATGADIRHGGTRAFYAEGPDYVQMPPFETFRDAESHAATLAHELTHATKHEKRLNRDMGRIRWGDELSGSLVSPGRPGPLFRADRRHGLICARTPPFVPTRPCAAHRPNPARKRIEL